MQQQRQSVRFKRTNTFHFNDRHLMQLVSTACRPAQVIEEWICSEFVRPQLRRWHEDCYLDTHHQEWYEEQLEANQRAHDRFVEQILHDYPALKQGNRDIAERAGFCDLFPDWQMWPFDKKWAHTAFQIIQNDILRTGSFFKQHHGGRTIDWCYKMALMLIICAYEDLRNHPLDGYFALLFKFPGKDPASLMSMDISRPRTVYPMEQPLPKKRTRGFLSNMSNNSVNDASSLLSSDYATPTKRFRSNDVPSSCLLPGARDESDELFVSTSPKGSRMPSEVTTIHPKFANDTPGQSSGPEPDTIWRTTSVAIHPIFNFRNQDVNLALHLQRAEDGLNTAKDSVITVMQNADASNSATTKLRKELDEIRDELRGFREEAEEQKLYIEQLKEQMSKICDLQEQGRIKVRGELQKLEEAFSDLGKIFETGDD